VRRPASTAFATLVAVGCTIAPAPADGPEVGNVSTVPPPGFGTLLQDEISISLVSGDLELKVTPLAESVTRVTAPDTYRRLSGIAEAHRSSTQAPGSLFLVSFYSEQPDVTFVPEEVQLISRGFRIRPGTITPITPTWGQRRVRQRETEMAVYAFVGSVDLESDLALAYGLEQTQEWSGILPRVQAERARARARAGIGN